MEGLLYYDDVAAGQQWLSPPRTLTQSDVHDFADLTGDDNPLHLDAEFASTTPFGRPIAHGLLGLSLMAGMGSRSPQMDSQVFVRIVDWRFVKPLYIGDTVRVETVAVEKRSAGRRRGLIVWRRRLLNQHDEVVQEGTVETLVLLHARANLQPR